VALVRSSASRGCHVLIGEAEVEDLRILCDVFAVRRLRDQDEAELQAPAQQHLRRGASDGRCGRSQRRDAAP
jgi:hypothetical protein